MVKTMRDVMRSEKEEATLESETIQKNAKEMTKFIKSKDNMIVALKNKSDVNKQYSQQWKSKHDKLKDELAGKKELVDGMSQNVAMRKEYEATIISLTPETFGKHWVKNIDKRGTTIAMHLIDLLFSVAYTHILLQQRRWKYAMEIKCR